MSILQNPIVSICCLTYNHAPFIRKALDGILMQEPPADVSADELWYEVLIHDDASTDVTADIIREYVEKYPDKIFPIYEKENQYSKVGTSGIDLFNYKRVRGKYIAYCEGDDYWTDPYKLQKQVDFMESHPEYSVCFHDFVVLDDQTGTMHESKDSLSFKMKNSPDLCGVDISAYEYLDNKFGQPLTMLFRWSMFDINWRERYAYYRDTHEIYHLLRVGRGYWMNFKGGVYNAHDGGISSLISNEEQYQISFNVAKDLYEGSPDADTIKWYSETLQWLIQKKACVQGTRRSLMIWKLFLLTGDVKRLVKNILI